MIDLLRGFAAMLGLLFVTSLNNIRSVRRFRGGRWGTVTGYVYGKRWVKLATESGEIPAEDYTRRFRIADMDNETRRVIVMAHAVARHTSPDNIGRLNAALTAYGKKHEAERASNLLRGIFGDQPTPTARPTEPE